MKEKLKNNAQMEQLILSVKKPVLIWERKDFVSLHLKTVVIINLVILGLKNQVNYQKFIGVLKAVLLQNIS